MIGMNLLLVTGGFFSAGSMANDAGSLPGCDAAIMPGENPAGRFTSHQRI
jgi:hypothetical protein